MSKWFIVHFKILPDVWDDINVTVDIITRQFIKFPVCPLIAAESVSSDCCQSGLQD